MAKIETGYNSKIVSCVESCEELALKLLNLNLREYYDTQFSEELFPEYNVIGDNVRKVEFEEILNADISPVFAGFSGLLNSLESRNENLDLYEGDEESNEDNKKFLRMMVESAFCHACKWLSWTAK